VARSRDGTAAAQEQHRLHDQVRQLQQQVAALQQRLARAVVLDDDKQAEFAWVGQARGVSLPDWHELREVLIPGRSLSVATLGRRTQRAAQRAGPLLAVLDEWTRPQVRDAAADEIYVSAPVLMVVEQASLCWVSGRLSEDLNGSAWAQELGHWPNLTQVARDGGRALHKGVALLNAQRQQQGQAAVVDQGDHFHALRGGSLGVRQAEAQAQRALDQADAAQKKLAEGTRQGPKRTGPAARASAAWKKAEKALDDWRAREHVWQQTKAALPLITPEGEVNSRARA
jgi:hypothetical protein